MFIKRSAVLLFALILWCTGSVFSQNKITNVPAAGQSGPDAAVVKNFAFFVHRDIEVDTDQHSFPGYGYVSDRHLVHISPRVYKNMGSQPAFAIVSQF